MLVVVVARNLFDYSCWFHFHGDTGQTELPQKEAQMQSLYYIIGKSAIWKLNCLAQLPLHCKD